MLDVRHFIILITLCKQAPKTQLLTH